MHTYSNIPPGCWNNLRSLAKMQNLSKYYCHVMETSHCTWKVGYTAVWAGKTESHGIMNGKVQSQKPEEVTHLGKNCVVWWSPDSRGGGHRCWEGLKQIGWKIENPNWRPFHDSCPWDIYCTGCLTNEPSISLCLSRQTEVLCKHLFSETLKNRNTPMPVDQYWGERTVEP